MYEGWLCDSILKAQAHPSPTSMMPAFSPGPCTTLPGPLVRSPRVGSRFRCTREDLYEQCSDHITEKIPSSVKLGVRPISRSIRAYSSAVMLCSFSSAGVICAGGGIETTDCVAAFTRVSGEDSAGMGIA